MTFSRKEKKGENIRGANRAFYDYDMIEREGSRKKKKGSYLVRERQGSEIDDLITYE